MSTPLSGTAYTIRSGDYTAEIASVGASLRTLRFGGRDLVVPFDADRVRPNFRGATLVPWPNRVIDGRYVFDGEEHRLALSEPARGHALHGLAAWLDFEAVDATADAVTLTAEIPAQIGYPFPLRVDVAYSVGPDGLRETVTTENLGARPAPYGTGPHPYLVAGAGTVDDWVLHLPAGEVLTVTPDRLIPVAVQSLDEHPAFDFRAPSPIGTTEIDHAFTGLRPADDGTVTVRVLAPDGSGVAMTWGPECPWVQVHTADRGGAPGHRVGLAVEPMTCPPDAFSSGTDLVVLQPGASHAASWIVKTIEVSAETATSQALISDTTIGMLSVDGTGTDSPV